MAVDLSSILAKIEEQSKVAQVENLKRYEQAMAIYDEIVTRYQPGGEFEKKSLTDLERRKTRDVGAEEGKLISSGLSGTTVAGGVGRRWEEEVGTPERLKLEDVLMQRLSAAQQGKAEFIERREDTYPDYGLVAQLASQSASGGGDTGDGGTSGGGSAGGFNNIGGGMFNFGRGGSGGTPLGNTWGSYGASAGGSTPMLNYADEMAAKRQESKGKAAGEGGYEGVPSEIGYGPYGGTKTKKRTWVKNTPGVRGQPTVAGTSGHWEYI